jgi:tetratricopeptide (TPR) repeat protein
MDNKQLKQKLLDAMRSAKAALDQMLDELPEAEKDKRGELDDWSPSDYPTHITFYNNHVVGQIEAAEAGERPRRSDYYLVLNDGIFIRNRDRDFDSVYANLKESFQKGLTLAADMSAEALLDTGKYDFMDGAAPLDRFVGTFGYHVLAHISDFYCQQGDLDRAARIQEEMAAEYTVFPTWKDNAVYNLACFYSLQGMKDQALEKLKIAFKDSQRLREWSKQDTDMDPLRDDPRYQALLKED